jgi:site-specific DNA-methyltransferase (adenine-specific)
MVTPAWQQGDVTLYLGDCLEVLPTLRNESVQLVLTDPPYMMAAVSSGQLGGKCGTWGDMMNSAFWYAAWYTECWRVLDEAGCFWTFTSWRTLPITLEAAARARIGVTSMLVWDKEWIGPGGISGLRPSYELIALMGKSKFAIPDRSTPDIWRCPSSSQKPHGHPAEKPERLLRLLIERTAIMGTVLDPFMGSGTTGVACVQLGRKFIGIEIDKTYFDIAVKRISEAQMQIRLPLVEEA